MSTSPISEKLPRATSTPLEQLAVAPLSPVGDAKADATGTPVREVSMW